VNAYLVCNTKYQSWIRGITHVGRHQASVKTGRLWRIAVLTAAGAIGATSYADAAVFWSDSDTGISGPGPSVPQGRQKPRRHGNKKIEAPGRQAAKPQGPLVIAISINKQNLRIFDANGFFAETPISTGMSGHPTPTGVFSVIQKQKLHHSNIYSGAPMPFMQRITWSGIAIHAGVLPGYPASHGCIRMPMAFAVKMYGWTKMGARVVVTPGELSSPTNFSHPLLVAEKVVPQPVATADPKEESKTDAPVAAKSDKAADLKTTVKPATPETVPAEANLELKSTIGHSDGVKPGMGETSAASLPLREQTHTADASTSLTSMSDATSTGKAAAHEAASAATDSTSSTTGDAIKASNASVDVKPEADPAIAKSGDKNADTASSETKSPENKPSETATAEIKPADTVADKTVQTNGEAIKTGASTGDSIKADAQSAEAKTDDVKADTSKANACKAAEKTADMSSENIKAVPDGRPVAADVKKDQGRLSDTEKVAAAKPSIAAAPKRSGQIAMFVSRKDSKLYVRQNFAPLFEVPVTIAPSDRPLGTHVFTAETDKNDPNLLHWSVVSPPVKVRGAEQRDEDERISRKRKMAGAVEMKPVPVPDSPAEALDRITIPADAMARITDALSTGASIIVSDQGINAGETGEGTDFIVSLR
jgi:lipoprotein-anchoring transpeptidase ErfK/SrfK